MSQRDRVLRMLRHQGARGVTPVDFLGPVVIDGGAPILRLAARVGELRNEGYRIETGADKAVARYVLVEAGQMELAA